jgi:hypothetical protein
VDYFDNVLISWPYGLTLAGVAVLGLLAILQVAVYDTILPTSLFPRNHFAIGGGSKRCGKELRLRTSLFWGVLVALAVSLLGSAIVLLANPS